MITTEIKKELFASNIKVIEEIVKQLAQDVEDAKKYLNNKKDSDEYNFNTIVGTLLGMPNKLKQLEDIKNVLESVHRL